LQAHDKREFPLTKVEFVAKSIYGSNEFHVNSECVKNCNAYPDFEEIGNRCLKKNSKDSEFDTEVASFLANTAEDLLNFLPAILSTCAVAAVNSYILLIMFRHAAKYVIWIVSIALLLALSIGCVTCLVFFLQAQSSENRYEQDSAGFYLTFTIVLGILALIQGLFLFLCRRRIALVSQLFKEASKVLIDLPLTIFEPILTFIAIASTCAVTIYFALIIGSSGEMKIVQDGFETRAEFQTPTIAKITSVLNVIAFLWFTSFIIGCQNFVVASTVSQWFFTRSKDKLNSPMKRAFSHLVRFHVGTICLGSIIITIIKIIRGIIENLKVIQLLTQPKSEPKPFGLLVEQLEKSHRKTHWIFLRVDHASL
jgi:solute carrier family 44 (choline transporter-like protein), member 1